MWFDVAAALAGIEARTPETHAAPHPRDRPVSQLSRVSQAPETEPRSAGAGASVAPSPAPSRPERARHVPSALGEGDAFRHGRTGGGRPRTWSGAIVSLEEWRGLSAWDRHGPDGRLWCGCCRAWVPRETALAHAEARWAGWMTQCAGALDAAGMDNDRSGP